VIERAVSSGAVRWDDVFYPSFNNTVEIIP